MKRKSAKDAGNIFRGAAIVGALFGVGVAALLALLNPAVTTRASDALALTSIVVAFYAAAGVAAAAALAGAAAFFPTAVAALRRRGIGTATFAGVALLAAGALFHANGGAYEFCVPAASYVALRVYGYFLFAAGALLLAGAAALGPAFARAAGARVPLLLAPVLLFAFPLARWAVPPRAQAQAPLARRVDTGLKVYLVACDALDADVVLPLARAGRAPALGRLIDEGASGELATIPPGLSPAIWTTIATGRYPRDHGITDYEYLKIKGVVAPLGVFPSRTFLSLLTRLGLAELRPFGGGDRRGPALWNISSAAGLSTAVAGWLTTTPPEIIKGGMVSDYFHLRAAGDADDAALTAYPPSLARAMSPYVYDGARVREEAERRLLPPGVAPFHPELFYRIYAEGRTYEEVSLHLLDDEKPQFWAAYFNPVDAYQHLYWGFRPEVGLGDAREQARWGDVVNRANIWADEFVGRVLARADEHTVVIVVSDHGFQTAGWLRRTYYRLWQRRDVSGVHDVTPPPAGFVALAGGPVKKGYILRDADVADVAPNVLYLLGLPAAADMPGRVWLEAYEATFTTRFPRRRIASYGGLAVERPAQGRAGDAAEAERRAKLKALGYL